MPDQYKVRGVKMDERAVKILYTSISYDHAVVKIGDNEFVLDATRGLYGNPLDKDDTRYLGLRFGYVSSGAVFWCVEDAQQFLTNKYIEHCEQFGIPEPMHSDFRGLMKYISIDTATKYLNMIEGELMPHGRYSVAKALAHDLHKAESVLSDPISLARVDKILEICSNENA
jgi:hypothetical protein